MKLKNCKVMGLALAALFCASLGQSAVAGEGQNGNGGAGVNRNGRYMTFYSAGFYIDDNEAVQADVPQLAETIDFFSTTPYMGEMTKVKYVQQLMPSPARRYYRVKADTFTTEVRARLIAEYGRVMNMNTNEVTIFAITDTQSRTTYLFPEFFSLKTATEQKAILFHEAYWLVKPKATYKEVIRAEMAFQAYLEAPQSAERLLRWLETAGGPADVLVGSINTDLRSGALNGLLVTESSSRAEERRGRKIKQSTASEAAGAIRAPKLDMFALFGEQFFNCLKSGTQVEDCQAFIGTNAYALTLKFPQSLFLRVFHGAAVARTIDFSHGGGESCFYSYYRSTERNCFLSPSLPGQRYLIQLETSNYSARASLIVDVPQTIRFNARQEHLIFDFKK